MSVSVGAVSRYYETKRQQYLDSLPERRINLAEKRQAEKKLTSRRRRVSQHLILLHLSLQLTPGARVGSDRFSVILLQLPSP